MRKKRHNKLVVLLTSDRLGQADHATCNIIRVVGTTADDVRATTASTISGVVADAVRFILPRRGARAMAIERGESGSGEEGRDKVDGMHFRLSFD